MVTGGTMMAQHDEDMQKLERALTEAHRARQEPSLGPDWARGVMRDIRHATVREEHRSIVPGAEQLVWRTAAVAATVAVILAVSIAALSLTGSTESAGSLAEEFELALLFPE